MYKILEAAITRSRTTLLILFMILLAGVMSRSAIPVEGDPEINVPFFVVTVVHEGISPEDAERLLVMPLEIELRQVEGVEELTAYASEGAATLMVEFDADYDLDQAMLDTRDAVDRAKVEFPSTAEEPVIQEQSTSDFPIVQVNIVGDVPERMLYNIALDLRDAIESQPGILSADVFGQREELLEAIINPEELATYGLSSIDLMNAISSNNRLIPAGSLDGGEGRFSVKVPSIIEGSEDIFDIPIKAKGDAVVTIRDVAEVRRTFKDRTGYARINGQMALGINVIKRADANILSAIERAKAVVEEYRSQLPGQVNVFYSMDQGPMAQTQVVELEGNIFTALGLVMVIVVAAMGLRSGLIVGIGIPASFLFSLIFVYLLGYSFNFMVMFGMLLGLGMLIDGAIVVTEYADRKMVEGLSRQHAYIVAAHRMFWPVTASIATTLAAFLPLMFWPGVSGKFMRFLPVTVFTVLSGSLLYALVFGPAIGSIIGRAGSLDPKALRTMKVLEEGDPRTLRSLTGVYARVLGMAARYGIVTMLLTVTVLTTTFWAYGKYGGGLIFFSQGDSKFAQVSIRARGNLSIAETNALLTEVEREVLEVEGIENAQAYTTMSGRPSRSGGMDKIGGIFLELYDRAERRYHSDDVLEQIRERTSKLAGIIVEMRAEDMGPPVGKPINIELSSYNRRLLEPATKKIVDHMRENVADLRDIDDTRSLPGIEYQVKVDRAKAAVYGADVNQVGVAVQLITNGIKVGEYRPDRADDGVDIRIRYPSASRGLLAMDELQITTPTGLVPLSNFVTFEPAPKVDTIQRVNGIPIKRIFADVAPGVLADTKVKEIEAWIQTQDWASELNIEFRGANEEQAESIAFVTIAFSMSLLLMFVLLVTQFNSFYQSTLILFAVILSTAGVLLGLLITGNPFSAILTGTGVVALAGIVVNNNIVLIDTYNEVRRKYPDLHYVDVIVRTGAQRLRPVMLTTVTTVFGLLPLASNVSIDLVNRTIEVGSMMSSFWVPLSQAIVYGLTFSTLLTLVTTPAMLALPHQIKSLAKRVPVLKKLNKNLGKDSDKKPFDEPVAAG
ncbi:MAG TPA: acriflavin resistance protein [Gammaproteobacteria bacterium]|nr:acriflavin resistance protein [Gammaproteobacteria bacterium]|tara:strand:+ start:99 stop:3305 length:3207 start_codon:yes stop_codon:yes gene_type:complete